MLAVGLTGGIGSGKSTVAEELAAQGAVVIDADRVAREVVEPGTPGLSALVDEFGPAILSADGALDRPALAAVAFADSAARARLNGVLHPRIGARTLELMAAAPADAVLVHDVPLLVENHLAARYHLVIVVDAPVPVRLRRLVDRGLTDADARARIAAQATDEQRRAVADVWLDNTGGRDDLLAAVRACWHDRIAPYAENLRSHRGSGYRLELAAYRPGWPADAVRLAARVAAAAGARALRVDHIGSTAVPGLPAKDVIDLQLGVASIADADALAGPLADAGFPRWDQPGAVDRPPPADPCAADPQQWDKRVHVGADPGRPANLHVRVVGHANWRAALLFRDWLRGDDDERDAYRDLKQRAIATGPAGTQDYSDAKSPWIADAHARAQRWAADNGWRPGEPIAGGAPASGTGGSGISAAARSA